MKVKNYHNILMQLRKVCNHPYLFDCVEPQGADEYGEHVVEASGKLVLVDRLLKKTIAAGEQALLFSGFTTMLDILEDFCTMRGLDFCRLDGSTSLEDRELQISEFTRKGSKKQVFLISTRAGGLGLNLMSANHVILYDSDWNPQVDLQAMDRAHRIGQTKKVYVYRLITKETVEEKMVERQAIKLKLDQVVIQQGHQATNKNLSKDEYEKILLHGAAKIMQAKTEKVAAAAIDVDKLIEQGEENHRRLKEAAEAQIAKFTTQNTFDLNLEQIVVFRFQEKDFREEKKRVQSILAAQQAEALRQATSEGRGRIARQAALRAQERREAAMHAFHQKVNRGREKTDKA